MEGRNEETEPQKSSVLHLRREKTHGGDSRIKRNVWMMLDHGNARMHPRVLEFRGRVSFVVAQAEHMH